MTFLLAVHVQELALRARSRQRTAAEVAVVGEAVAQGAQFQESPAAAAAAAAEVVVAEAAVEVSSAEGAAVDAVKSDMALRFQSTSRTSSTM